MVGAIGPAVSGRRGTRASWHVPVLYTFALLVGGGLMFLAVAGAGNLLMAIGFERVLWVVLLASVGGAILQAVGGPAVQSSWQVPEAWRRHIDLEILVAFYGFLLGIGVVTSVVVSAFWVFVALTAFVGVTAGAIGWTIYSVVRGLGFWILAARSSPEACPRIAKSRWLTGSATLLAVLAVASGWATHSP